MTSRLQETADRLTPSTSGASHLPPAELLWASLVDSIDCFVTVLDRDQRIVYLNHTDVGYAGVEEVLGRQIVEFVAPSSHERVRRIIDEVFATGRPAAYEVEGVDRHRGSSTYSVRVSPVRREGQVVAVVTTAIDGRRLHETEQALRAEQRALRQFIRTQERERQLISYEIHDGLAQYLAGAMMHLETFKAAFDSGTAAGETLGPFEEGLRLVRAAVAESRRLINGLRPPMLDELGIVEAVESLVADARADVPNVVFEGPKDLPRIDPTVETVLFRIVQESLSNVRKHADAAHVKVILERRGDSEIAATVSDDGAGFDPTAVPEGCFGLEGIRHRARLFGREPVITAAPGRGTTVEVVLPTFPAMMP